MIVSCPNCKTRYRVELAMLGSQGRPVRCRRCRHVWRQVPQAEKPAAKPALPKKAAAAPPPPPPPAREEEPAEPVQLFPEATDGEIEPVLSIEEDAFEAFRARRRLQLGDDAVPMPRRHLSDEPVSSRAKQLAIGGTGLLLIALVGAGYAFISFRDEIARAVPQTAAAYAFLAKTFDMPDLAVNVRGLAFVGVKQSRFYDGGDPVLSASGTIVNVTASEVEVPEIKIALHDASRHQLMALLVKPQADKLAPNMSTRFGARITNVPAETKFVECSFARPEDLANATAQSDKPPEAEKAGESEKPAAAAEPEHHSE